MKRTSKLLALSLLSLTCLAVPLTACDSFTGGDGYTIANIVTSKNGEGDTVVVISFTDDAADPVTFIIPAGDDGVGIANVEATVQNNTLSIVISYTDPKFLI